MVFHKGSGPKERPHKELIIAFGHPLSLGGIDIVVCRPSCYQPESEGIAAPACCTTYRFGAGQSLRLSLAFTELLDIPLLVAVLPTEVFLAPALVVMILLDQSDFLWDNLVALCTHSHPMPVRVVVAHISPPS